MFSIIYNDGYFFGSDKEPSCFIDWADLMDYEILISKDSINDERLDFIDFEKTLILSDKQGLDLINETSLEYEGRMMDLLIFKHPKTQGIVLRSFNTELDNQLKSKIQ